MGRAQEIVMKKLFLSAFALSLITGAPSSMGQTKATEEFLGLEMEILPELHGAQRFTGPDFHETKSWNVEADKVVLDREEPLKGQKHSIIQWSDLDPEEWLNVNKWITDRAVKDDIPEWKIRLREAGHQELMGKVLTCRGECRVFRGSISVEVQHLSRIHEGDEFETGKDSVAWIYLMDGSLLRVSPGSSFSFHEINFSDKEIFLLTRLNYGHVYWHPRETKDYPHETAPETDSISLPLLVREANQEHFERLLFRESMEMRVAEMMNNDQAALKNQIAELNRLRTANNQYFSQKKSKVMMVAPNATLIGENTSFDFLHVTGGSSWFKKRSVDEGSELNLHLRGYAATDVHPITEPIWYEIEKAGRSYHRLHDPRHELQILELLTKRIKTIELAREIWTQKFTLPVLEVLDKPEQLARLHGYRHWYESEMSKRFNFLIEYTRRVETTNLRSVQNLLAKLENNNEAPPKDFSDALYEASLKHYLLGLKSRYDKNKLRVREMNDLLYYVWILRNGKF